MKQTQGSINVQIKRAKENENAYELCLRSDNFKTN